MFSCRSRWPDFDYIGKYRYFLTFCTHNRREIFVNDPVVAMTRSQILRAAGEHCFNVIAHVFMPDHLHLLVEGTLEDCNLRAFAARAKQAAGFEYKRQRRMRLWQPSYYDHVLRDEEATLTFVRYIIDNPVGAGLVSRAEEYPYSGTGPDPLADTVRMLDQAGIRGQG